MNTLVDYGKAIAASSWMHLVATRGEFQGLKRKTAIVVPGAISKDVCRQLIEKIDSILAEASHPRVWRDNVASDTRILGFEKDIPELLSTFELPRRIAAIDAYTGRKTRSWFLMANCVVPKENNLGSGGGLHRDSPFSHQVKCIWYLSDVNTDNGPFQYVPDTHFNLIKTRAEFPLGKSRFDSVDREIVEVTAEAGSLLICDTKCIHGGKPIESGKRYAVTLYTLPDEDGAEKIFLNSGLDPVQARRMASS